MRIAVIDGLGGGMGKVIVEKLRKEFRDQIDILALGTRIGAFSHAEGRIQDNHEGLMRYISVVDDFYGFFMSRFN